MQRSAMKQAGPVPLRAVREPAEAAPARVAEARAQEARPEEAQAAGTVGRAADRRSRSDPPSA